MADRRCGAHLDFAARRRVDVGARQYRAGLWRADSGLAEVHVRETWRPGTPRIGGSLRTFANRPQAQYRRVAGEARGAQIRTDRALPEGRRDWLSVRRFETLTGKLWQGSRPCPPHESLSAHSRCLASAPSRMLSK